MPSQERCEACKKEKCLDWNKPGEHLGCGFKQGACCGGHPNGQYPCRRCDDGNLKVLHVEGDCHPADQERKEWWLEEFNKKFVHRLHIAEQDPNSSTGLGSQVDGEWGKIIDFIRRVELKAREEEREARDSIHAKEVEGIIKTCGAWLTALNSMAHSAYLNMPKEKAGDQVNKVLHDALDELNSIRAAQVARRNKEGV